MYISKEASWLCQYPWSGLWLVKWEPLDDHKLLEDGDHAYLVLCTTPVPSTGREEMANTLRDRHCKTPWPSLDFLDIAHFNIGTFFHVSCCGGHRRGGSPWWRVPDGIWLSYREPSWWILIYFLFTHRSKQAVTGTDESVCSHHKDKKNTGIGWERNLDHWTIGMCLWMHIATEVWRTFPPLHLY